MSKQAKSILKYGTNAGDYLIGGAGDDMLIGLGGRDILRGGAGRDYLDGGSGNDTFRIGRGDGFDKLINGGAGWDRLEISTPSQNMTYRVDVATTFLSVEQFKLMATKGKVWLQSGGRTDLGGFEDFTTNGASYGGIRGTSTKDVIHGFDLSKAGARDVIKSGSGDDIVFAHAGHDRVYGGDGDDSIDGGAGNDRLYGGAGDDDIRGGQGNDVIKGGAGADSIFAGTGDDMVFLNTADNRTGLDTIDGGAGFDTLKIRAQSKAELIGLRAEVAEYLAGDISDPFVFDNGLEISNIESVIVTL